MAIAFSLPSDECTLEHYRRIQQLLLDLINLLRTLITTETPSVPSPSPNSTIPATSSHFAYPTPPSSVPNSPSPFSPSATSSTSAFVLPDVITSAASIDELRNFLISRNSSSMGPAGAPAAPTFAPVPPSILRPHQDQNESQRIPVGEPVHNRGSSSAAHKLRKRKRARISRKKKCCAECVQNESPAVATPSSNQSNQTMPGTAATTCTYDRYHKIPRTKATQNQCSCNDEISGTDTFANTAKITPSHRNHHHQITRNYVPSAADSEFYMDPAYYRRIATAAAAAAANDTASDCKEHSWMFVGEELRKMTDGFRQSNKKDEKLSGEDISEGKGLNGIISQCGRTVFAAALLVLGWKLLKQN